MLCIKDRGHRRVVTADLILADDPAADIGLMHQALSDAGRDPARLRVQGVLAPVADGLIVGSAIVRAVIQDGVAGAARIARELSGRA